MKIFASIPSGIYAEMAEGMAPGRESQAGWGLGLLVLVGLAFLVVGIQGVREAKKAAAKAKPAAPAGRDELPI